MSTVDVIPFSTPATSRRAAALFDEHQSAIHGQTDRLFAVLMLVQWAAGVVAACALSPRTWDGASSRTHPHVYAAVLLGGAIASLPVLLAFARPGAALTRHVVAVSQVLFSALLIHLTGGRIETHFHVFGSLAFLAVYRDWRVLATASAVVALDHLLRGVFWPQSVFGVATAAHWRWLEHVGWVAFEDVFLVVASRQSLAEMREVARRQAAVEAAKDAVEAAKEAVEAADRAKGTFLANVSHEIRTPLTAILGYNDLMRSPGQSSAERAECVQTIGRNGQHLLAILSDLLDLSKIEAGQMTVELLPSSPRRVVDDVVSSLRPRAAEKGLGVEVVFETPVPDVVRTDPTRLRQILNNLLGNAIKFTESGSVRVSVGIIAPGGATGPESSGGSDGSDGSDDHSGEPQIAFRVTDTGIGLTAEQARGCSVRSHRPTPRPAESTAAPGWASPSPNVWPNCWAGGSRCRASRAKAARSPSASQPAHPMARRR